MATERVSPTPADAEADRPDDAAAAAVLARVEFEVAQLLRRADRPSAGYPKRPGTGSMDRAAYLLLRHLVTEGAENVNVLAEQLGLDASTVTRQVVVLEKAGHVRRTRDPHDGRAVLVEPTDAGVDALAANRAERQALYADVLGSWSRLDRALLAELLGRLNADLSAYRRRSLG
jgi:DNA-binding MarR family transcriptional regulator